MIINNDKGTKKCRSCFWWNFAEGKCEKKYGKCEREDKKR